MTVLEILSKEMNFYEHYLPVITKPNSVIGFQYTVELGRFPTIHIQCRNIENIPILLKYRKELDKWIQI